jgi:hypothetical protein
LAAATGTHRPEDDGGGRAGEARLPLARVPRWPAARAGLLRGDGGRRRGLRARVRRREPRRVGRAPRRRQLQDALREEELGTVAAPL